MSWNRSEATERFDEVVEMAISEGPQEIETAGAEKVFLISERDYARMNKARRPDLIEYILTGPSLEGVDLTRDRKPMRDIEL